MLIVKVQTISAAVRHNDNNNPAKQKKRGLPNTQAEVQPECVQNMIAGCRHIIG